MGMYLGASRLSAAQAEAVAVNPDSVLGLMEEDLPGFDVGKAWGGLDYLLRKALGDAGGFLLAGGERVGEIEDFDYGPPRLFVPDRVAELARLLDGVPEESLRGAYDPKDMGAQGVYPSIWEREGGEGVEWLLSTFGGLRGFVRETASGGGALLLELG